MRTSPRLKSARLSPADTFRVAGGGLRARPLRVVLSALGIALGIAAMVCVVGISASSQKAFDERLKALGTNVLTVGTDSQFGSGAPMPRQADAMVRRVEGVTDAASTGEVKDAKVYRNDRIPAAESNAITVLSASADLPRTLGLEQATGSWFDSAQAAYPTTVLGAEAARRLGIHQAGDRVWLGEQWFTVIGILAPAPLTPDLDNAALVGRQTAERDLGFDGHPTSVYVRVDERFIDKIREALPRSANPAAPNAVAVSRPSDALAAKHAAEETFTALLLGLGAVSLLVGGVGVANTMIIAVLERRGEIGLRRALGATSAQIRTQFLTESVLLSALGGAGGTALGIAGTLGYALWQGWPPDIPAPVIAGGLAATLLVGAAAGLWPAVRASRMPPSHALASP
ncbi:ABC transporter permease [Streptomyces pathocidini]|uniref:ABC transporter permease n=1 Tax=Streptomyces pathocidini TaxID=1650571 RepID=UPI0033C0C0C1